MHLSNNEIKRLGERLRQASTAEEDLAMLDAIRRDYDGLLIESAQRVESALAPYSVAYVMSGRSKRTKSIIRKLRRPTNKNMDLSRMQDIVGLRLLVGNVADQDRVVEILHREFVSGEINDYREDGRVYRTVHLVFRVEHRHIEIQVRTLAQHLWAVESESFGEQTKEGSHANGTKDYLTALSAAGKRVDAGESITDGHYPDVPLFGSRQPFDITFPYMTEQFTAVTAVPSGPATRNTFIVVFDGEVGTMLNTFAFDSRDRERALEEYHKIASKLTDERYETVLFNAASSKILQTTHPRFFVT